MIAIIQRCSRASVRVDGQVRGGFDGPGLMVLLGILADDTAADADFVVEKLPNLRVFPDEQGKMNRSVLDVSGSILLVPNFTLAGDASRGRRPSFDLAMRPEMAEPVFAGIVERVRSACARTSAGVFRAHMDVEMINDGPVTIVLDSMKVR